MNLNFFKLEQLVDKILIIICTLYLYVNYALFPPKQVTAPPQVIHYECRRTHYSYAAFTVSKYRSHLAPRRRRTPSLCYHLSTHANVGPPVTEQGEGPEYRRFSTELRTVHSKSNVTSCLSGGPLAFVVCVCVCVCDCDYFGVCVL